jgi:hypothetical protein
MEAEQAAGTMVTIGGIEFAAASAALDLSGSSLGPGSPALLGELGAALPRLPHLAELDLSNNPIVTGGDGEDDVGGLVRLLPLLEACRSLTSVSLAECGLGAAAAAVLAERAAAGGGPGRDDDAAPGLLLRSLTLSGNRGIKDQGMVPLLGALAHRQLTSLDLSACGLGPPRCGLWRHVRHLCRAAALPERAR